MRRPITTAMLALVATFAMITHAADEVKVTALLTVENGSFKYSRTVNNLLVDQTTQAVDMGIYSATTSTNALPVANVATPRYAFFRNLGTTNITVTLTMLLRPSDVALLPLSSTNVSCYTAGGTHALEYWINAE